MEAHWFTNRNKIRLYIFTLLFVLLGRINAEPLYKSARPYSYVSSYADSKVRSDSGYSSTGYYGPSYKYLPPSYSSHSRVPYSSTRNGYTSSYSPPAHDSYIVHSAPKKTYESSYINDYKYVKPSYYSHSSPESKTPLLSSHSLGIRHSSLSGSKVAPSLAFIKGAGSSGASLQGTPYRSIYKKPVPNEVNYVRKPTASGYQYAASAQSNTHPGYRYITPTENTYSQLPESYPTDSIALSNAFNSRPDSPYSHSTSLTQDNESPEVDVALGSNSIQKVPFIPQTQVFKSEIPQYESQPEQPAPVYANPIYKHGSEPTDGDTSPHLYQVPSGIGYDNSNDQGNVYSLAGGSLAAPDNDKDKQEGILNTSGNQDLNQYAYSYNGNPQPVNTDFSYDQSFTKAPFKPSTFLGAHLEPSDSFAGLQTEYGPPAGLQASNYNQPSHESVDYHGASEAANDFVPH